MHEFSIAQSIIDIAEKFSGNGQVNQIREIDIEIGELSGIVFESLEFALEIATKGTPIEKTKYNLIRIDGCAKCNDCGEIFDMHNFLDCCPLCGGINREIKNGKQLHVKSIKIE